MLGLTACPLAVISAYGTDFGSHLHTSDVISTAADVTSSGGDGSVTGQTGNHATVCGERWGRGEGDDTVKYGSQGRQGGKHDTYNTYQER